MTKHPADDKAIALIMKLQSALEGEANDVIAEAAGYLVANAVAILAKDRAEADLMMLKCADYQNYQLGQIWDRIRAELKRRGIQ